MEQEGGLFGGCFWVAARSQGLLSAEDSDCFVLRVAFELQHEAKGDYRPRIPIVLFGGLLFAGNRY